MLYGLDIFFIIFHSTLIVFILFGWIWRRTQRANLILILLTVGSWFGLGIWYGIGYCPSTDWHWQVRRALGHHDLPNSYVKFLIDCVTGLDVDAKAVDAVTVTSFGFALLASIYANVKGRRT